MDEVEHLAANFWVKDTCNKCAECSQGIRLAVLQHALGVMAEVA